VQPVSVPWPSGWIAHTCDPRRQKGAAALSRRPEGEIEVTARWPLPSAYPGKPHARKSVHILRSRTSKARVVRLPSRATIRGAASQGAKARPAGSPRASAGPMLGTARRPRDRDRVLEAPAAACAEQPSIRERRQSVGMPGTDPRPFTALRHASDPRPAGTWVPRPTRGLIPARILNPPRRPQNRAHRRRVAIPAAIGAPPRRADAQTRVRDDSIEPARRPMAPEPEPSSTAYDRLRRSQICRVADTFRDTGRAVGTCRAASVLVGVRRARWRSRPAVPDCPNVSAAAVPRPERLITP